MQFRVQARKLQFIRSVYNKQTKRCDQKLVGSMSADSHQMPSDDQIEMLTDSERQALAVYLENKAAKSLAAIESISAEYIGENLILATNGILAGEPLSEQQVSAIWDGLAKLTKALKQTGHPKPAKKMASTKSADF